METKRMNEEQLRKEIRQLRKELKEYRDFEREVIEILTVLEDLLKGSHTKRRAK